MSLRLRIVGAFRSCHGPISSAHAFRLKSMGRRTDGPSGNTTAQLTTVLKRWLSSSSPRPATPPPGPGIVSEAVAKSRGRLPYLERQVIYHAGTGRTTFIAMLKVTTVFVFIFFVLLVAPNHLTTDAPRWRRWGVVACGLTPLAFVLWATAPFVTAVHVHLPPWARASADALARFARRPPPETRLHVATVGALGRPRVRAVAFEELAPARRRLGLINLVRRKKVNAGTEAEVARFWRRGVKEDVFYVDNRGVKGLKTGWVWKEMKKVIETRSAGLPPR